MFFTELEVIGDTICGDYDILREVKVSVLMAYSESVKTDKEFTEDICDK